MKLINKRRSILSLTIAAVLTVGIAGYMESGYAGNDNNNGHDNDNDSNKNKNDSDVRGNDDETKKVTICHVPPGNAANAHTIHIGASAWPAHRDNHGGDYLGSCTQAPAASTTNDEVHVISGCGGEYRKTLITKVQSYYEPIVVSDDALDDTPDETVLAAVSQCLSAGDSSDSGKGDSSKDKSDSNAKTISNNDSGNKKGAGKGFGHDSVSDSGKHHVITGCKNKVANDSDSSSDSQHHDSNDSQHHTQHYSDSEKNLSKASYHKSLKGADSAYDKAKGPGHGDSAVIVSDSSLDDSGKANDSSDNVLKQYKACLAKADDSSKFDSTKVKNKVDSGGDSGHKYHVVNVKDCPNAEALKTAVEKHKERVKDPDDTKYKDRPIVLTKVSLDDVAIHEAYAECLDPEKGGGTESIQTDPPTPPATFLTPTNPSPTGSSGKAGKSGRLNWREITNP